MARAKYSALRERSVGLGVMGFPLIFANEKVPIESVMAKVWNKKYLNIYLLKLIKPQ